MIRSVFAAVTLLTGWAAVAEPPGSRATLGTIRRVDPRFDKLIAAGARVELLTTGFQWAEGPVWVRAGNYLLFSDVPRNKVWKWQESGLSEYLHPSGFTGKAPHTGREPGSNGLALDAQGRLVLCQHGDRRVARRNDDGTFTSLADRYQGRRFNSPNDLAFKSNGALYFTDPPYGLPKTFDDPGRELSYCGVYRLGTDGAVTLLTKELSAPNGIAFAPDERTLYVANSDPKRPVWMAYTIGADGLIAGGRVFFDASAWVAAGQKGLPDGLKVDRAGNVFATGPGGVCVFAPDGTHLGTLEVGVPAANCAWGNDGSMLYITADKNLARVQTTTQGY
jgi:gluconolactonase